MGARVLECGTPVNLSASGQVGPAGQPVQLLGFYVNSTSGGTVVFKTATSGGAALNGAITPAIGFHRYPLDAPTGLYCTIATAAIDITLFVVPNS